MTDIIRCVCVCTKCSNFGSIGDLCGNVCIFSVFNALTMAIKPTKMYKFHPKWQDNESLGLSLSSNRTRFTSFKLLRCGVALVWYVTCCNWCINLMRWKYIIKIHVGMKRSFLNIQGEKSMQLNNQSRCAFITFFFLFRTYILFSIKNRSPFNNRTMHVPLVLMMSTDKTTIPNVWRESFFSFAIYFSYDLQYNAVTTYLSIEWKTQLQ